MTMTMVMMMVSMSIMMHGEHLRVNDGVAEQLQRRLGPRALQPALVCVCVRACVVCVCARVCVCVRACVCACFFVLCVGGGGGLSVRALCSLAGGVECV